MLIEWLLGNVKMRHTALRVPCSTLDRIWRLFYGWRNERINFVFCVGVYWELPKAGDFQEAGGLAASGYSAGFGPPRSFWFRVSFLPFVFHACRQIPKTISIFTPSSSLSFSFLSFASPLRFTTTASPTTGGLGCLLALGYRVALSIKTNKLKDDAAGHSTARFN